MSFIESIIYMAWRGVAIGVIISAPMGPVGMLCIQRTLDKGRRTGFYTGVGAAISDLFYSLLTGFGLSFIEEFLERNQNVIQLIGSAVLIAFGVYLFRKNPTKGLKKPVDEHVSVQKNILGGFLFTVSNPLILFLIVGLFARFNFLVLHPMADPFTGFIYLITGYSGIFVGALLWWWFITFSIDKVRSHFNIRSMWLINKIIGVIILIFAVVGIITACSALAKGADIRCWNATRGYGPFSQSPDATDPHLTNSLPSDTLFFMAPCDGADAVELRTKVRNHTPGKDWGLVVVACSGERVTIAMSSVEGDSDGISTSQALAVEVCLDSQPAARGVFADKTALWKKMKEGMSGPDPSGSLNFFKVVVYNDLLTLFGGLHTPERLLQAELPKDFRADSIGFFLTPTASISTDETRLTLSNFTPEVKTWDDPALLDEYLSSSRDPLEGYWQVMDRSLDEALLRMGGDYRMAMVREGAGYVLLYISGARINADAWRRGMVKATLSPSGIPGVWDVCWTDAMHQPMAHELKAQTDSHGVITIQFPYQYSSIRLFPSMPTPGAGNGR